jgi:hypothetical protein
LLGRTRGASLFTGESLSVFVPTRTVLAAAVSQFERVDIG